MNTCWVKVHATVWASSHSSGTASGKHCQRVVPWSLVRVPYLILPSLIGAVRSPVWKEPAPKTPTKATAAT
jgi:hypothetical protein